MTYAEECRLRAQMLLDAADGVARNRICGGGRVNNEQLRAEILGVISTYPFSGNTELLNRCYVALGGGWRDHSKQFAKGVTPPQTIESLQAAWDRDQELIFMQKAEISKHKETINQLRQKLASREQASVADGWREGYRAAMNNAGWGGRELYVKHQHHDRVDGLLSRCKQLEQSFISEADAILDTPSAPAAQWGE